MRIALLISGNGTTAEAILRAIARGELFGVEAALVVSSNPHAMGMKRAVAAGVALADVLVVNRRDYVEAGPFGEAIIAACRIRGVDFIGQYGWMVHTPPNVIYAYPGMMVNQHPGPLDPGRPDFGGRGMYGKRVHCARLFFVRTVGRDFTTEATAQRVGLKHDEGAILARRVVPISYYPRETTETLAEKMLPIEHALQIQVLRAYADGSITEHVRQEPLVRADEVHILEEAKRVAWSLFPQG